MGEPVGFYTARRPSGPPPQRQFIAYEDQFRNPPSIQSDPYGWRDPYHSPDHFSNGSGHPSGPSGSRSPLKSQDPPHQEPIWPSTASVDDPFEYRYEYPVFEQQQPQVPYQDRSPEPADMPQGYPDNRYINPPPQRPRVYEAPVQRYEVPQNYHRPRTPDNLDDRDYPRDRYGRPQTPDALDERINPPRQVYPDRARRAATPDMLDGRPPRPPAQDPYRRARTPDILDDRPPKHPENRYQQQRPTGKPNYYSLERPPLIRQEARTPEPVDNRPRYHTIDNRGPVSPRPVDPYQRARTPDFLEQYPTSPPPANFANGDYGPYNRPPSRSSSFAESQPRLQRAPSVEPYYVLDPYGNAKSMDNLDDMWGQMMTGNQGNQDYRDHIPDLVMTACKKGETLTVRVDRVTRDQVDVSRAYHVGDGPFKDIIINKPTRKLPEVDEPEIKMKFLVHMKDKRKHDGAKEVRELRYWFKPYINDDTQTDNAKEYFKTLLQPEAFPRDYVGFLKKALVLTRNFPMVARLEIAMYPAPLDADKRASFIDTQEEQVVVDKMQPLMDPVMYGSRGGPGGPGGPGTGGSGMAFRDNHGPDLFAKVKQGDGKEYYKDADDESEDDIDYDQIVENFITVLTPNVYDYQYLPEVPVSDKTHIVFQVKAKADAHLALSSVYGDTDRKTYEVVIGGWNNKKSCIRYGGQGDIVEEATTFNILSGEELRRFWISWDRGLIQVGEGRRKGTDTFLRYKIPENRHFSINCLAVSTGQDSKGEWEFVELIRPKTADGINFSYKTEKAPTHSLVSRIRRNRTGPRRGPRPWPGDDKPQPRRNNQAQKKSAAPVYATVPKRGNEPPSENIKAYPKKKKVPTATLR